MLRTLSAIAAAAMLTACASNSGGMAAAGPAPTRMDYMQRAAASDAFEIQSSQLALQKSQTPAVRQYAQMMIDHHTMTTRDLTAAAQRSGLTPPPPALTPDKAQMISSLQSAAGASFDQLYLQHQLMGHQEALALHSSYAAGGDDSNLKQVAQKAVPVVRGHLDQVQSLAKR